MKKKKNIFPQQENNFFQAEVHLLNHQKMYLVSGFLKQLFSKYTVNGD